MALVTFAGVNAQGWVENGNSVPDVWQTPAPVPNTQFGKVVAVDGEYAVLVTAFKEVYVQKYESATDAWSTIAQLSTSETLSGSFANAVAINGGVIAISDTGMTNDEGNTTAGAVFIYEMQGEEWSDMAEATVVYKGAKTYANFGFSIALTDEVLVVGAQGYWHTFYNADGAVYVYQKGISDSWASESIVPVTLKDPSSVLKHFGSAVAIEDDVIVVGSPRSDVTVGETTTARAGEAFVYKRDGALWTDMTDANHILRNTTIDGYNELGSYVAISNGVIYVGSMNYKITEGLDVYDNAGAILVYGTDAVFNDPTSETDKYTYETAILTAPIPVSGQKFGTKFNVKGDVVVVGVPTLNEVYIFEGPVDGAWTTSHETVSATLSVDGLDATAKFGTSTGFDGNTIVVGAPEFSTLNESKIGKTYLFAKPGTGTWVDNSTPDADAISEVTITNLNENFGYAMDIDGSFAVVGAPGHPETVYVLERTGDDWAKIATLTPSVAAAGNYGFGNTVAIKGSIIVIGALDYKNASEDAVGAAFVYEKNGTWADATETAILTADNGVAGDKFGVQVATDGTAVAVVASNKHITLDTDDPATPDVVETTEYTDNGSIYVYEKQIDTWTQVKEVYHTPVSVGDQLGYYGVEIEGDVIVAGAHNHDYTDIYQSGAGFVFTKTSSSSWSTANTNESAVLKRPTSASYDYLGQGVDLSGEQILMSTNIQEVNLFEMPEGGWTGEVVSNVVFKPSASNSPFAFGDYAIDASSGRIVVGDYFCTENGQAQAGAVYIFEEPVDGWLATNTETWKLVSSTIAASNHFGYSVALDGDYLLVGEKADDAIYTGVGTAWSYYYDETYTDIEDELEEASVNTVTLSPNPFTSTLTFRNTQDIDRAVIYNIAGAVVRSVEIRGTEASVSTADLPAGMYVVQFLSGAERVQVSKVIKR